MKSPSVEARIEDMVVSVESESENTSPPNPLRTAEPGFSNSISQKRELIAAAISRRLKVLRSLE